MCHKHQSHMLQLLQRILLNCPFTKECKSAPLKIKIYAYVVINHLFQYLSISFFSHTKSTGLLILDCVFIVFASDLLLHCK